jgi:dihydrofolate synthase / folylpolyglutamate synthase
MSRGDGGFGDPDFGGGDYDSPDLGDPDFEEQVSGRRDAGEELPEGEGPVLAPDEAAEDAVLRHVLDAVRGGDTPDVVPASSSVAGFAEFLAV